MSNSIKTQKPITNLRLRFLHAGGGAWPAGGGAEEAEQRGYERGYQDGTADARRTMLQTAEQLKAVINSVEEFRRSLADRMAEDTAKLAARIASKIIGRELTVEDTVAQVAKAIKRTSETQELTVRLNATELHDVAQALQAERIGIDPAELRLVADASVGPGGCIVDAQSGRVDARIETQLCEIEKLLLDRRQDTNAG